MERRKAKRFMLDVPVQIKGIDLQGNPIGEETFAMNISASGMYFISTREYDKNEELTISFTLPYPIGNYNINPGKYSLKCQITRIDQIAETPSGQLKKENIAIQFGYTIGVVHSENPWADPKG